MYDDQKCRNTERKPQRRQITHNWMSLGDEIMDKKKAFLYPWIHIGYEYIIQKIMIMMILYTCKELLQSS